MTQAGAFRKLVHASNYLCTEHLPHCRGALLGCVTLETQSFQDACDIIFDCRRALYREMLERKPVAALEDYLSPEDSIFAHGMGIVLT